MITSNWDLLVERTAQQRNVPLRPSDHPRMRAWYFSNFTGPSTGRCALIARGKFDSRTTHALATYGFSHRSRKTRNLSAFGRPLYPRLMLRGYSGRVEPGRGLVRTGAAFAAARNVASNAAPYIVDMQYEVRAHIYVGRDSLTMNIFSRVAPKRATHSSNVR